MQIKNLNPNRRNPRKISEKKLAQLKTSMEIYGDLGCIVFNSRTGNLISGHQRTKIIPGQTTVKIEKTYDTPSKTGTVKEGYVEFEGDRLKYREVSVSEKIEMEMIVAANKIGGQWDAEIMRLAVEEIPDLDLNIAGFDDVELESLNIKLPKLTMPAIQNHQPNAVSDSAQAEKSGDEETDEQYLKNNPGSDSHIDKERIPSTINYANDPKKVEPLPGEITSINPFEQVKEDTKSANAEIIAIIRFDTKEARDAFKTELRAGDMLTKHAAKMY